MRIVKFTAENIKKLKVVEITPTGAVVQLTGPNGSGKSSVLDGIYMALAGAKAIPGEPIRKGEDSAKVRLDLGEIVVTRQFRPNGGSTLTVSAADGATYKSPQAMLDSLLGTLAFDPLAFARMEPKNQLETLRGLVRLDADIDALDRQNLADYQARTERNRLVADLKAQAEAIDVPANLPAEPVDVNALLGKMESAAAENAATEKRRANRAAMAEAVADRLSRAATLRLEADQLCDAARADQAKLDSAAPLPDLVDVSELRAAIGIGQDTNRQIEARSRREGILARLKEASQQSAALTAAMDARTKQKADTIARAEMPVPNLSFGDGEVLLNGLPFAQASSAEQLRVSVALAMAANPKLRILRVKDGGLLDEDSLAMLTEIVEANDFQVWMETAGTHRPGIIMQDGEVAK